MRFRLNVGEYADLTSLQQRHACFLAPDTLQQPGSSQVAAPVQVAATGLVGVYQMSIVIVTCAPAHDSMTRDRRTTPIERHVFAGVPRGHCRPRRGVPARPGDVRRLRHLSPRPRPGAGLPAHAPPRCGQQRDAATGRLPACQKTRGAMPSRC